MRYRDTNTGAVLEPSTEFAADQMAKNPALEPVEDKPKATRKRTTRKKDATE